MRIGEFHYELPPGAIAQEPLAERDGSRLLVLDRRTGESAHRLFRDLPVLLDPGDLLVVNRSRVFPARLRARRHGGGAAEVLLVQPLAADARTWSAWLRPGRRIRCGDTLEVCEELSLVVDEDTSTTDGRRRVRLVTGTSDVWSLLEAIGHVPLPPYIERDDRPEDRERYQTLYARERGSVAAPTAGLHFSERVLAALCARGIERAEIVLHVGPGTFQPVKVDNVEDHRVEAEPFEIPEETAEAVARAKARGSRVVAVGTTSVRALETAALDDGRVLSGRGETTLVVSPPYSFRVTDALVTNFHLPRSSLLLLVAAFAGRERILAAYAEAVSRGYRFYSYGDAMLIV